VGYSPLSVDRDCGHGKKWNNTHSKLASEHFELTVFLLPWTRSSMLLQLKTRSTHITYVFV